MPRRNDGPAGPSHFTFPLAEIQFADSGAGDDQRTIRGHAAVFNRLSHDLGGFRTKIAPGAFTKVLDGNPDVHLFWDHDSSLTLARTKNGTLELREDPYGLHVWARLAGTSYAKDLAVLMERGDIDQMSFSCDIGADEWVENDQGIVRTIIEIEALYDATVCAQGAFPQTDSSLAADLASAKEAGRILPDGSPKESAAPDDQADADHVASDSPVGGRKLAAAKAQAALAVRNHDLTGGSL